jgi:[acyl-carrier-protein] S-malonyltransferase
MNALLFPGQGSQFVGMARDLYETFKASRSVLDRADEVLGFPLTELMFSGPAAVLQETRNAQPAILAHSIAAWEAARTYWPPSGLAGAGHSLGEYSAYVVAGAIRFEDALRLVRRRGELMSEAGIKNPGTMIAVIGVEPGVVAAACRAAEGRVVTANLNSPGQIVISGETEAVREVAECLKAQGAKKVVELRVSGAFHSPLMGSAAAGLREALEEIEIRQAFFPVYANVTAKSVTEPEEIRASLVEQMLNPVLWEPTVRQLAALDPDMVWEIGPGQVLKGLVRSTDRNLTCRTLGTAQEVLALKEEARQEVLASTEGR